MVVSLLMWIVTSVTISYLIVIGIITYGWFKLSALVIENDNTLEVRLSVVIAVRNEAGNIEHLLKQLVNQDYNSKFYEVIIVDDHSTDNTYHLVNHFLKKNTGVKINILHATGEGKKSALKEGVATSSAKLIVTTDGDCDVKPGWLKSIVTYYNYSGSRLIIGPVIYENEKTLLQKFFSLDFTSLVASGAGSAGAGLPLMGNGANLAFERDIYTDNKANDNSRKFVSGDDVFLIHEITKKYGAKAIGFLRSRNAIVSTLSPKNIGEFFNQRSRWASKATGYRLLWPVIVSLTVFLFNILLFLMLTGSLFFSWLLPVYLLIILTKFIIDMPLVFSFLSFAEKSKLKTLLFFMEFIYPVYIVFVAVASLVFRFNWKGRGQLR